MKSIEKIEHIFQEMQKNDKQLSKLLPQMYSVAIECKDYEGFCILFQWERPLSDDQGANMTQFSEAIKILFSAGLDKKTILEIRKKSAEKYIQMRSVDGNKICPFSAREMEDYFVRAESMISATNVPSELHPVDLYFRSEEATKTKLNILLSRQVIEKQYAVLESFMTGKLAYYQLILGQRERKMQLEKGIRNSKKIFIIHGHNEAKRRELEDILKSKLGLEPVVLSQQPNQGMTIIEKFEKYASECSYAFALFTPDDIVTAEDGKQYFQARPNVIFELGWFYANLGRARVCILDQASEKSSIFSDLQGVMRVQFNSDVSEKYVEIERELKTVGIV